MQEDNIRLLTNKHAGKTCYIIGSGTSILKLTEKDFEPECPIIAINMTISVIEKLKIDNPIYSMQKDATKKNIRRGYSYRPERATLLVECNSSSIDLFPDYSPRYIFNAITLRPSRWGASEFSANCALKISERFGCIKIKMIGFDSYWGNINNFYDEASGFQAPKYMNQMKRMVRRIKEDNLNVEWVK